MLAVFSRRNLTLRLQLPATSGEQRADVVCVGDDADIEVIAVRIKVVSSSKRTLLQELSVCARREVVHPQAAQVAPAKETSSRAKVVAL